MIIFILLIALVVTVGVFVAGARTHNLRKTKAYRKSLCICAVVCAALIIFCLILGDIYNSKVNKLQAQYDNIMLYNEIVELCDSEQVRFGHYEKIEAFNEAYDYLAELEEGFMFGVLFPKDWSADMGKIDFYFRGVNYGYEG